MMEEGIFAVTKNDEMITLLNQDGGISFASRFPSEAFEKFFEHLESGEGDIDTSGIDTLIFETEISDTKPTDAAEDIPIPQPDPPGMDLWVEIDPTSGVMNHCFSIRVMLWANPEGMRFLFKGRSVRIKNKDKNGFYSQEFCEALNARNVRLGYPSPFLEAPAKQRRSAARPVEPLKPIIKFKSDNINSAAVRSLCAARNMKPLEGFAYGVTHEFENLKVTIGLPDGTQADNLWAFLCKGGAPMVKAHYALWGRWYESGSGREFITVNINQFCADIGYTRHHKGGYRIEHKQEAMKILEALTSLYLRAIFTKPGSKPGLVKAERIRGDLWSRGLIADNCEEYTDLFGQAREGDPNLWEPLAFSYAPGPWFSNEEWCKYNRAVGKIASRLMHLSNDKDEWPILIGGYLGTVMRVNQYAPLRLFIGTILERTGLAQTKDAARRAAQYSAKIERALDRLVDVGVISKWTWPNVNTAEISDPDNPEEVAAYYAENVFPKGDWRARLVEISFPFEADTERLQNAQQLAVSKAKTRAARKRKLLESGASEK